MNAIAKYLEAAKKVEHEAKEIEELLREYEELKRLLRVSATHHANGSLVYRHSAADRIREIVGGGE